MSYYNSDEKITFDEGDELVRRFISEFSDRRSRVKTSDVIDESDIPNSRHNQIRVYEALERQCEIANPDTASVKKFKI